MEVGLAGLVAAITALVGSSIAIYRVIFVEPKAARQTQVSDLWDENRELREDLDKARSSLADAWSRIDQLRDSVRTLERRATDAEATLMVCQHERQRLATLVSTLGGSP